MAGEGAGLESTGSALEGAETSGGAGRDVSGLCGVCEPREPTQTASDSTSTPARPAANKRCFRGFSEEAALPGALRASASRSGANGRSADVVA